MSKVKQYEVVLARLVAANKTNVSREELEALVPETAYRLSTYIWDIKKYSGGDIKVMKNGKKVVGYILLNPDKLKNVTPAPKPKKTIADLPKKAEVPKNVGELASYAIDPAFDKFDVSDVVKV